MNEDVDALGPDVQDPSRPLPVGGAVKRLFDVTLALAGLLILAPTFLLISLLITLSDGGPVFYRDRRIGLFGRGFNCLKFRTMVVNGNEVLTAHLYEHSDAREEWTTTRKLKADPRVTPVGAVLRKLSIDELPQLINVLRGDMSIVGPRPIVDEEMSLYGTDAIPYYLRARPGLTGRWQVSGRSDLGYEVRVALDADYVRNWSLREDLMIVLKTIPAVLSTRGTY